MADERSRMEASQALADQLGSAAAAALMECIPPFGWHEIATKSDLRALEERIDARFEIVDAKFEKLEAKVVGELHRTETRIMRWCVATTLGTITAVGAAVAAVAAFL